MSFGFSVTDFVTCAELAWKGYKLFVEGPGECKKLANDLCHFSYILRQIVASVNQDQVNNIHVFDVDGSAYVALVSGCKEFLRDRLLDMHVKHNGAIRKRFDLAKYASRVPGYRQELHWFVEKLTALEATRLRLVILHCISGAY